MIMVKGGRRSYNSSPLKRPPPRAQFTMLTELVHKYPLFIMSIVVFIIIAVCGDDWTALAVVMARSLRWSDAFVLVAGFVGFESMSLSSLMVWCWWVLSW